jgi:predicted adenylyl cyclase CyaB
LGAKLTNHSHIIDYYYCDKNFNSLKEQNEWFSSSNGFGIRIREIDNDYSGKINTTLEIKKLAGPDFNDHSNCLETEIDVIDFRQTERLVMMMNLKKFITIDKERFVYRLGEIKFCFDSVKGWGDGLEIEKLTDANPVKVKKELFVAAKKIGLGKTNLAEKSFTHEMMRKIARF